MKKKLLILAVAILCLSCFFVISMSATEESTPTLEVTYTNLSFKDTVYIKYAVAAENVTPEDVRMYVFTEPQSDYKDTSKATVLLPQYLDEIEGEEYIIFDYTNLSAKQMTDVVYAYAAVEVDGTTYYSNLKKYSILRYAFDMRTNPEATDDLNTMLADMLTYGSSAQKYFDYKANRPANGDWYDIRVVGGTHADGFAYGLHMAGDELTLIPAEAPVGKVFSHWENAAGEPQTLPITAPAQNEAYTAVYVDRVSEGLKFALNGDGQSYAVTGIGECSDTVIIIPATYEGLPVTEIGEDAFRYGTSLTSITIPDSVTRIGVCAFSGRTTLTTVIFGENSQLTAIDRSAFCDCKNLTSIEIPNGVKNIGTNVFQACTKLVSINIPDGVTSFGNYTFSGCTSLTSVVFGENSKLNVIAVSAFDGCTSLSSITIPDCVVSINSRAFMGCTNLASVSFGENSKLRTIDETSFANCTSLTSIEIPDSVMWINNWAFYNCTSLASVTFGENSQLTSIGGNAFLGCDSFATVYYGGTVTEWDAITIGSENSCLTDATRYYYSATQPTEAGNYWHYEDDVPIAW